MSRARENADLHDGSTNITTLGTVTAGNISHADIVYPDRHIINITTTSTAWNQTSSSSANYLNLSVTLSSASNDVAIFYGNQLRKSTTATGGHIRVYISGGGLGDGASGKQVVGQLGYSLGNGPDYPFGGCVLDDAPGGTSVTYSIYVVPVSSAGVQFKLNLIAMEMQGAAA